MNAFSGWIVIDKPLALGSTQAVGAVKRALRDGGYARVKIGHGGTLDPLATGVLPIALGEATKLAGRMLDASKIYDFTVRFGEETDTLDLEGEVMATADHRPGRAEIAAMLPRFTGQIDQAPPAYSALKVDGRRAYDLARAGEAVTLATRRVHIHALDLVSCDGDSATFRAHVSKGTYIRSLARDIARALGTVGHVTMLRRVRAGQFALAQAISLDKLAEYARARTLEDVILPITAGLDDIPALDVGTAAATILSHGGTIARIDAPEGLHFAYDGQRLIALVDIEHGTARVVRGFNV